MRRLSGQDAYFLYRETPTTQQHTLKVAICEPAAPRPSFEEIRRSLERHLHLLPPLRRRLVAVPLGLHHPVWIEDPDFDLARHLRRARVPAPGGRRELDAAISEIATPRLDRSRPLWELWVLEGLAGCRTAFALKVHHAVADGVAAAALIERTAVRGVEEDPPPPVRAWEPEPVPSAARLLRDAGRDHLRQLARLPGLLARTARGLRAVRARQREAAVAPPAYYDTPATPFNRALRSARVFATTSLPLAECRRVRDAFGVTLNDVVLALCAGSLRRYLAARGPVPDRPLVASVPVAADAAGGVPRLEGNRVSYFQTGLRVEIADPVERLLATSSLTREAKRELDLIGKGTAVEWMDYLPPVPYTWLRRLHSRLRLADHYPSPSNLVVSNVPGPREPLFWSGARLVELYSVGPLSEGIGLNVTLWSYCERLYGALIACREQVPEPAEILEGMGAELAELVEAAARRAQRSDSSAAPGAETSSASQRRSRAT